MKFFKKIQIIFALVVTLPTVAQQLPQFTQYMYNTISVNPAYAGSREALSAVALYRNQWTGFDGAPKTNTLSVHTPLRDDRIGLGLSFINDNLGSSSSFGENFNFLYGDFSYTIKTGEKTKLAFGLKAGFTHYSVDQDAFDDPQYANDPLLVNNTRSKWSPNMGAGLYYHTYRWYIGLSTPRILNNRNTINEDIISLDRVSYYLTGGYVFDLNPQIKLKPAFMVKATNGAPLSFDTTLNFLFYEKLWLGASYRFGDAFGAIADFQISKQIRIGYAYESPVSDIKDGTNGTHEILAIFELKFNNSKMKSPRYF